MVIFPRTLYKTLLSVFVQSKKHVDDRYSVVFASISASTYKRNSFTLEDPDPPEFFSDGRLEIGGFIAEHFGVIARSLSASPGCCIA